MYCHFEILVAEDNPHDAFFLKRAFLRAGINAPIQFVDDGKQAVSYLGGTTPYANRENFPLPHLMLLDIKMPRCSSAGAVCETARRGLRALPSGSWSQCALKKTLRLPMCSALCIGLLLLQTLVGAQPVQYETVKGKIRIEGTSNIDDWQVESKSVAGHFKAGADFPAHASQAVADGKVAPEGYVLVEVHSLKSIEKDGKPFSNLMDEIMHAKLKAPENPQIRYRLTHLKLSATPKAQEEPFRFECKGELAVAGVTNQITMPINVLRLDGQRLRIWGNTALRMTDFRIEPPAPKIALGVVKTGDEVKISFEWVVAALGQSHSGEATGTLPR